MFTGIVEEIGQIRSINRRSNGIHLTVGCSRVLSGNRIGDSIAVNGICLTAEAIGRDSFTADVMPETMRRTGLGLLRPGAKVNLERALEVGSRLGGHLVSGHVDGTGTLTGRNTEDNAIWLTIATGPAILNDIVLKGSITLNGVSLTVAAVDDQLFKVSLVPHTAKQTTLGDLKLGDTINIECDPIGKYVSRQMAKTPESLENTASGGMTMAWLAEQGFD